MPAQPTPPSAALDTLQSVVAQMTAGLDNGDAVGKQVRWVAGMLGRALERHPDQFPPDAADDLAVLLSTPSALAFLDLARAGELRRRTGRAQHGPSSDASVDMAATRLRDITRAAGLPPLDLPARPAESQSPVNPVVPAQPRALLLRHLEAAADHWEAGPEAVRLLAMLGLVLDTGARSGELGALTLHDVDAKAGTVRITRRPQHRVRAMPPVVETIALSKPTIAAVRRWLEVRADLVTHLQGSDHGALWVSVRPGHNEHPDNTTSPRPVGSPLMARGVLRSFERGIVRLNLGMAGFPGWEPLSTRMEQLRRAIELEAPPGGEGGPARAVRPRP
ncbi:tyrosine-type recombinase/integrase [Actinacidiphila sp. bgisy160]|uniref:tyrosine-type recombinase/integrase n=1 Tax=Actinacidiphila sp. bgisy160 TaxID=3413796 RepID=UPI003D745A77